MRSKVGNALKYLPLIGCVYSSLGMAATDNMAGNWDSITLSGSLDKVSPSLKDFRW